MSDETTEWEIKTQDETEIVIVRKTDGSRVAVRGVEDGYKVRGVVGNDTLESTFAHRYDALAYAVTKAEAARANTQCKGTTQAGSQCTLSANYGGYCKLHAPGMGRESEPDVYDKFPDFPRGLTPAIVPTEEARRHAEGTCKGETKAGKSCSLSATHGEYCKLHAPDVTQDYETCEGETADGNPCGLRAKYDGYCHLHDPEGSFATAGEGDESDEGDEPDEDICGVETESGNPCRLKPTKDGVCHIHAKVEA